MGAEIEKEKENTEKTRGRDFEGASSLPLGPWMVIAEENQGNSGNRGGEAVGNL